MRKILFLILFIPLLISCSREGIFTAGDDSRPPSVPANLNIFSAHDGVIGLEWSPDIEQNIKGYNIYRSAGNGSNPQLINFTTGAHFIDYPLSYDTAYFYAVSALNKNGLESTKTALVFAQPYNRDAPDPVYGTEINGRNDITGHFITLNLYPPQNYDIKGYLIYRSETEPVNADTSHYIGFTGTNTFNDSTVQVLKTYYYCIVTVDRGGLKSTKSGTVSGIVLDTPEIIYPLNNSTVKNLHTFQFKTAYAAAEYKIVIQSNELYGPVAEFVLRSNKVNDTISFDFDQYILESYKKYYWRVISYSTAGGEPNSYSPLYSFTYIAE